MIRELEAVVDIPLGNFLGTLGTFLGTIGTFLGTLTTPFTYPKNRIKVPYQNPFHR